MRCMHKQLENFSVDTTKCDFAMIKLSLLFSSNKKSFYIILANLILLVKHGNVENYLEKKTHVYILAQNNALRFLQSFRCQLTGIAPGLTN